MRLFDSLIVYICVK